MDSEGKRVIIFVLISLEKTVTQPVVEAGWCPEVASFQALEEGFPWWCGDGVYRNYMDRIREDAQRGKEDPNKVWSIPSEDRWI